MTPLAPSAASESRRLRAEIAARVEQLVALEHTPPPFRPGETPIPYSGRVFDHREATALVSSALDMWLTAGPVTTRFERALSEYTGARAAVMVNSGSSANLLALAALTSPKRPRPLQPGDEVITCAVNFPTTVNPIFQLGCVPVFVDVELGTYNVDLARLEAALSPRTRAIVLAHALGNPFDLATVQAFAAAHDLELVEDACDALGATWAGRMVGTFGAAGTLSFYPAHQMTTGEGGAVLLRDAKLRVLVESFRDWGRDCWCEPGCENTCGKRFGWQLGGLPHGYDHKYTYSHIGYNMKSTDLQAAVGLEQLAKMPAFVARRQRNFDALNAALAPYGDALILPRWDRRAVPSWYAYPITVRDGAPFTKDALVAHLEQARIATRPLFCGNLTRQPAYANAPFRVAGELTASDTVLASTFFVGVYPGIDDARVGYMIETFARFFAGYRGER